MGRPDRPDAARVSGFTVLPGGIRYHRGMRSEDATMAQVYFHCSNAQGVVLDRRGSDVEDLIEVREHAARIVRTLLAHPGPEDWRDWVLHISDADGEEILLLPFSTLMGRVH